MSDPPDGDAHPLRWRVLRVSLVIAFVSLLDVTLVNVAVPSMRSALATDAAAIQWVVSGYSLAYGLLLVAGGALGDAFGRRPILLTGLAGYVVASAAVGFAPTIGWLIVARLVQGACVGVLTPQAAALIQQFFAGEERGRAFGFYGLTAAVSSIVGPLLSGSVIAFAGAEHGWRWLFLINVPMGLAALVAVLRLVPRKPAELRRRVRIDLPGMILLGLTVLALLYPIVTVGDGPRAGLFLLVVVPLLAFAFVRWERRTSRRGRLPLLDVAFLRTLPGYASGLGVGTLYFGGFAGLLLVLSVYLQEGRGVTALVAGLLLTSFALGSAISAPLTGRLVSRLRHRVVLMALSVMMTGVALVAVLVPGRPPDALWWLLPPALLVSGLGSGAVTSPNFTLSLEGVPRGMSGVAGGALQTGNRIGASVGAALVMTVYGVALREAGNSAAALRAALVASLVVVGLALLIAVWGARSDRVRAPGGRIRSDR
ncbi:MFS transporter [Acrocarpospora catenulata]|uniref:MFS transporter n=1 Tax=Acrocarpospora catenulata TaxID=2836182 RepID=UPI001BD9AAD0|nr:MFS transporter [Acrocarpospora catenulata]